MFSKEIEFSAHEDYFNLKEDYPEPIKLNLPDWFKKLKHSVDHKTIKGCMPFLDSLTSGYLLKMPQDFYIQHNVDNTNEIELLTDKVRQTEISIEKGRGFVLAEENKKVSAPLGTIFIDSIYTPIKNVKYAVENFRVEQKTDYEKLVFDIITDGSITPKDALTEAAKILIHHFMLFSDERITLEADEIAKTETYDEESLHMRQLLKTRLIDMDLSVRALNCLKAAEVDTLGDLVSFNKSDLMKFRNFGKKSLTELDELVNNKGLTFGMDLTKYKLDKE